jgi:hypothetical protein
MATTVDAPPAPPSLDSPPPPPPAPTSEIHVTPAAIDTGPKADPPKKGSARAAMMKDLEKLVKPNFYEQKEEPKPSPPAAKVGEQPAGEVKPAGDGNAPAGQTTPPAAGETKPEAGKKSPWKLVDEYKARAAQAESQVLELKKVAGNPDQIKEWQASIADLRKQNEALENEIRFTNYAKSDEFKSKYQAPYEKAWERAVKELSEVTVTDPGSGQERAATVADLAELVNMPLGKARATADALFGPFADDVMQYRKEIMGLYEQQQQALTEAKSKGIQRDKERTDQQQKFLGETSVKIKEFWDKANDGFLKDKDLGPLLSPTEGDEDGNNRLANGFKLVDQAFSERSDDPNLTPDQRAQVVKRHAAVRMRAAAFGRVYAQYKALQKKFDALNTELSQYKETTPGTGGTTAAPSTAANGTSAWSRLRAELARKAGQ